MTHGAAMNFDKAGDEYQARRLMLPDEPKSIEAVQRVKSDESENRKTKRKEQC
jgi:hypothetical protein